MAVVLVSAELRSAEKASGGSALDGCDVAARGWLRDVQRDDLPPASRGASGEAEAREGSRRGQSGHDPMRQSGA